MPKKVLRLKYHGRIIEHLGIQMYQSPVAAMAELISNAWDANAQRVDVYLPDNIGKEAVIKIKDDGIGMTFEECEEKYLNVGWCRRGSNTSEFSPPPLGRPILGRKGIGKFAGFGIAKAVEVATVSERTGEKTCFILDLEKLKQGDFINDDWREIEVISYASPDENERIHHGTTITLHNLTLFRTPSDKKFILSMSRRFLLHQTTSVFNVFVNNQHISDTDDNANIEFSFPKDYKPEETSSMLSIIDGWGIETLPNKRNIKWRILFYKEPIDDEELQGVSIFSGVKLAQTPFFFNLSGGLGGQHGQSYVSGRVQADYIDSLDEDIIAPERQRIRWEHPEAIPLEEWGKSKLKELYKLWRERRGEARRQLIEKKVAGFSDRLEMLPSHERKTVKKALTKVCSIPSLSEQQFQEIGEAILQSWEQGRLRDLIEHISSTEQMNETELLNILIESQILTALNMAEAVKTKLETIAGLKNRIQNRQLENAVRDYIAKNPWLVSPEWDTFKVEKSYKQITDQCQKKADMTGADWDGRVDLVLSSGEHLLLLEFMRPGLTINWDHLSRFERYVLNVRAIEKANSAASFKRVSGFIVADNLEKDVAVSDKIDNLKEQDMFALDWRHLFSNALSAWRDFLENIVQRSPSDDRLKVLLENND